MSFKKNRPLALAGQALAATHLIASGACFAQAGGYPAKHG